MSGSAMRFTIRRAWHHEEQGDEEDIRKERE